MVSEQIPKAMNAGTKDPSKKDMDRAMAGLKAAIDPSAELLALGKRIQNESAEAFAIATRAGLLGEWKSIEQQATGCVRLQQVAENAAGLIGDAFSAEQFTALFKEQSLADGWTLGQALAAWYSLGNLALLIAALRTHGNQISVTRLYDVCKPLLLKRWQLGGQEYEMFRSIVAASCGSDIERFGECKSGNELFLFFGRYLNRILGRPEILDLGTEKIVNGCDAILCIVICRMFVDITSDVKNYMSENV